MHTLFCLLERDLHNVVNYINIRLNLLHEASKATASKATKIKNFRRELQKQARGAISWILEAIDSDMDLGQVVGVSQY
jgi:hypothetical protein